jgi:hypothetical protein
MAAPRTALSTGNGTQAAPNFGWEGMGAPPPPSGVLTPPPPAPKKQKGFVRKALRC